MRNLAGIATSSLVALCVGLSLVVVAVATIGILGAHSSTILGRQIASDELGTSTATVTESLASMKRCSFSWRR